MRIVPSRRGRKYGFKRSPFKNPFRTRYSRRLQGVQAPLPPSVDLRPLCPPVYDQGNLGSCTANAIAGAYAFERIEASLPSLMPSRLFIYWNERVMEGTAPEDSGAYGGDGITSLEQIGVPDESLWPYDVTQFAVQPPQNAYAAAGANKVLQRQIVTMLDEIKSALVDHHLVVFGISLYESFESDAVASTGFVPDPLPSEGLLGGHEMAIVGYDDSTQRFLVRNSWGDWGMAGYCTLSYNYIIAGGSDFEVIVSI